MPSILPPVAGSGKISPQGIDTTSWVIIVHVMVNEKNSDNTLAEKNVLGGVDTVFHLTRMHVS